MVLLQGTRTFNIVIRDSYRGVGNLGFPPPQNFSFPPPPNSLGKFNKSVNTYCNSLLFITKSKELK